MWSLKAEQGGRGVADHPDTAETGRIASAAESRAADPSLIAEGPFGRLHSRLRHFDGPADVRDFLSIGVALMLAPVALSRLGLGRCLARLAASRKATPLADPRTSEAALVRASRLALYADIWLSRLHAHNPCLRRSLILFARLRRTGVPVTFCLGIRNDKPLHSDQPVTGHAWLELGGKTILESEADAARLATTFRYPPDPPASG